MSHAGVLLELLRRERERQERLAVIRARYAELHEARRRAHEEELRSAELLEVSEMLVMAVKL